MGLNLIKQPTESNVLQSTRIDRTIKINYVVFYRAYILTTLLSWQSVQYIGNISCKIAIICHKIVENVTR